jgi:hypothetical protein
MHNDPIITGPRMARSVALCRVPEYAASVARVR